MKDIIRKLLREALENDLKFSINHVDGYKNQSYWRCDLYKGDERVAYADFSTYGGDNEIHISYIESKIKGMGYGQMIMKHLASIYGYENLERTSLTPDGEKMRQKLDKHFDFDYNKHKESKNRHLGVGHIENIKNPIIKNFLKALIVGNRSDVWGKFLKNEDFVNLNKKMSHDLDLDFNDVAEIAEWVKDSKENDNYPEDSVPRHILKTLAKLFKY